MQYVTYENMFTFELVLLTVVTAVIAVLTYKKKQPPEPEKLSG